MDNATILENNLAVLQKVKHKAPINLTPRKWECFYTETSTECSWQNHSQCPKAETTQCCQPMDGLKKCIYPCSRTVFSNTNIWSTDACHNMREPWKHAEGKKPFIKDHVLYVSIYMKCPA
jgi:hypothetical protein